MRKGSRSFNYLRRHKKMTLSLLAVTFVFLYHLIDFNEAGSQLELSGSDWWLIGTNLSLPDSTIPGDVYYELYRRNITPDPYYRNNDVKLRWISRESWTYAKSFQLETSMWEKKFFLLKMTGVDTICDIFLNGNLLVNTSNMFRIYRIPVAKDQLKQGLNQLELRFRSPQIWARQQNEKHFASRGYHVPPGSHYPPGDWNGEPHGNYIRKMQASFSWDWGPAFPTMGVNGPISLFATDTCVFLGQTVVPFKEASNTSWTVKIDTHFWCATSVKNIVAKFEIRNVAKTTETFGLAQGENFKTTKISADNVQLWWPNNFGNQTLYQLISQFQLDDQSISAATQFGFRTTHLVEEPPKNNTRFGLTFYFKVNGIPVFLKGANWIPADSFLSRLTCDRLEFLLRSVQLANMNVLRVWGGGVYEPDCFYDLADRYGILIWQDLMFACAMYPGDPEYVANVREEFRDQMRRISSHPSLLLYCGNNENEMGFAFGWFNSEATRQQLTTDYLEVFQKTAESVLKEIDPSRPYILSSPTNGKKTLEEGGMSSDPNGILYGDKHFWTPVKDSWFSDEIPLSRCPSEFGIQSLPSLEAFRQVMQEEDLSFDSPMYQHRQHQEVSNSQMLGYINDHLVKPKHCGNINNITKNSPKACTTLSGDLGVMIYLTQLNQAVLMKTEIEHYRRGRSIVEANGAGLTMCALYWQLNDIWQAPTWSSIDFVNKWKFLHYFAKRFNAQVLISPYVSNGMLKIFVINDGIEEIIGASIVLEVMQMGKGFDAVVQKKIKVDKILPLGSQLIYEKNLKELIGDIPVSLVLLNVRLLNSSGKAIGPNNVVFPTHPKKIPTDIYGSVAITKVEPIYNREPRNYKFFDFLVTIQATNVAPFVWLEVDKVAGVFSDNGYTQMARDHSISFHCEEPQLLEEFQQRLTITTFRDLYNP